jgi:hypothetical protein
MSPQTPTKLIKAKVLTATPKTPPAPAQPPPATPHAHLATEPIPLPGISLRARLLIVLAIVLVGAAIAAGVTAVLRTDPPPDALAAAQAGIEGAMRNLRASNWLNLQDVTREELERRIGLLDAAIKATDTFSYEVSKLDRVSPENEKVHERRDAFNARAKVLRMGRLKLIFLHDHVTHWWFDPDDKQVLWDKKALRDEYRPVEALLDDGMAELKAAAQPSLPPGPPFRNGLFDPATEPDPAKSAPKPSR